MDEFIKGKVEGLKAVINLIEKDLNNKLYYDYTQEDFYKEYLLSELRGEIELLLYPREPLFQEKEMLNSFGA
jgi:hypothetical protein